MEARPGAAAPPETLEQVVLRLQAGHSDAMEALIRLTHEWAFRDAYALLRDRDACQDAMQDVYLTVFRKIGQLREAGAFRVWFRRLTLNHCQTLLRSRRRQASEPLADAPEAGAGAPTRLEVLDTFAQLAPPDQAVLALRDVHALSYAEIAEVLAVPQSTVRARLYKARQRFLAFWNKEA